MPRKRTLIALAAGGLTSLVLALFVVPTLFADPLVRRASRVVERATGAQVTVGDADISLFRAFPRVAVGLHEVELDGSPPFADSDLLTAQRIDVGFDLFDLVRGRWIARSVTVDTPRIHAIAGPDDTSNYAFDSTAPETTEEAGGSDVVVQFDAVTVDDLTLVWEDREGGLKVEVEDVDLIANGEMREGTIVFETTSQIADIAMQQEGETWIHALTLVAEGGVAYGLDTGRVELRDVRGTLNALPLTLSASITPVDDVFDVELAVDTPAATVAQLLSLVPVPYRGPLEDFDATGDTAATVTASGRMDLEHDDYPTFDARLQVTDGTYANAALPSSIRDLRLDAHLQHAQGPLETTHLDVSRMGFAVDASTFSSTAAITDLLGDPRIDATLKGDLDLGTLAAALPEPPFDARGRLDLDLRVTGRQSDLLATRTEGLTVDGRLVATALTLEMDAIQGPVTIERAEVVFDEDRADVDPLRLSFGEGGVEGTASLENLLGYGMAGQTLTGRATLQAQTLDLRPFAAAPSPTGAPTPDAPTSGVPVVPTDLDVRVALDADEVLLPGVTLDAVTGAVHVQQGIARLDDLSWRIAGGTTHVDGTYTASSSDQADLDLDVRVEAFDIPGTLEAFDLLRPLVPASLNPSGRLDGSVALAGQLDASMSLLARSLAVEGDLVARNAGLRPAVLTSLGDRIGRSIDGLVVERAPLTFTIAEGRLSFDETTLQMGGLPTVASGSVGVLDQVLDIRLQTTVPTPDLASDLVSRFGADLPRSLPLVIGVGGTVQSPALSIERSDPTNVLRDLRDTVEARAREAVDTLVAAGRADVEREIAALMETAKRKARRLRRAADEEAETLIERASNPIARRAAQEGAKVVRQTADAAAERVLEEARKEADQLRKAN